jgi:hypothetical protein
MQMAQATGKLEIAREGEQARLDFERGRLVFARTSGNSVRAGEVLVHQGAVSPDAIESALSEQRGHAEGRDRPRIGELLVRARAATEGQVAAAVRETLRRIVYGVLLWREGRFRFVPGERADAENIRLDLDIDRLILEGLRLADQARGG